MLYFGIKKERLEKNLNTFSLAANILKCSIKMKFTNISIFHQNHTHNLGYNTKYFEGSMEGGWLRGRVQDHYKNMPM